MHTEYVLLGVLVQHGLHILSTQSSQRWLSWSVTHVLLTEQTTFIKIIIMIIMVIFIIIITTLQGLKSRDPFQSPHNNSQISLMAVMASFFLLVDIS